MKFILLISAIFLFNSCAQKQEDNDSRDKYDREFIPEPDKKHQQGSLYLKEDTLLKKAGCDDGPLAVLKLSEKRIQEDFFTKLDSLRKFHHPQEKNEKGIFVDITPALLNKFLKDIDTDQLKKLGRFKKKYNFNIAPPKYSDSKECMDEIVLVYSEGCTFILQVYNSFFAEGCQESMISYIFTISVDKIYGLSLTEAG